MDAHPLDNITFRRAKTQLHISHSNNESDMSIDTLDVTTCSLPDISSDINNEQITCLLQKIEQLQIELNSAHAEIESLCLENRQLSKNNQELTKKNALYKKIGNSPSKFMSSTLSAPKPTKVNPKPKLRVQKETQTNETQHTRKIHKETQTTTEINKTDKETQTKEEYQTKQKPQNNITFSSPTKNQETKTEYQSATTTYKPKLCLISDNKNNKVLSIAQDTTKNKFNTIHYLTSNGPVKQLLKGLKNKLKDYTMEDYCIILIGDQDFQQPNNNLELINYIKEILQDITHTNVVMCTPTYHYGYNKNNINKRIQNFNNLILQDVYENKYAFLLDSNSKLNYDNSMFYKASGRINNYGLRTIFQNLMLSIKSLRQQTMHRNSYRVELITEKHDENQVSNQFFLA